MVLSWKISPDLICDICGYTCGFESYIGHAVGVLLLNATAFPLRLSKHVEIMYGSTMVLFNYLNHKLMVELIN